MFALLFANGRNLQGKHRTEKEKSRKTV